MGGVEFWANSKPCEAEKGVCVVVFAQINTWTTPDQYGIDSVKSRRAKIGSAGCSEPDSSQLAHKSRQAQRLLAGCRCRWGQTESAKSLIVRFEKPPPLPAPADFGGEKKRGVPFFAALPP